MKPSSKPQSSTPQAEASSGTARPAHTSLPAYGWAYFDHLLAEYDTLSHDQRKRIPATTQATIQKIRDYRPTRFDPTWITVGGLLLVICIGLNLGAYLLMAGEVDGVPVRLCWLAAWAIWMIVRLILNLPVPLTPCPTWGRLFVLEATLIDVMDKEILRRIVWDMAAVTATSRAPAPTRTICSTRRLSNHFPRTRARLATLTFICIAFSVVCVCALLLRHAYQPSGTASPGRQNAPTTAAKATLPRPSPLQRRRAPRRMVLDLPPRRLPLPRSPRPPRQSGPFLFLQETHPPLEVHLDLLPERVLILK